MDIEQVWYKVIKDNNYYATCLDIFCGLHDYRISHIYYDLANNTLYICLRYDTDTEGVLLKFIDVVDFHIHPEDDYEIAWLFGATIQFNDKNNTFFWYESDDDISIDEVKRSSMNWIESQEIHFAWLDKENQMIPLTEERLNPICHILNYETMEYEEISKHYKVYKVES